MNEALDDRVLRLIDKNTSREGMLAYLHGTMAEEPASVFRIRRLIFFIRHGVPVDVADDLDDKLYKLLSELN